MQHTANDGNKFSVACAYRQHSQMYIIYQSERRKLVFGKVLTQENRFDVNKWSEWDKSLDKLNLVLQPVRWILFLSVTNPFHTQEVLMLIKANESASIYCTQWVHYKYRWFVGIFFLLILLYRRVSVIKSDIQSKYKIFRSPNFIGKETNQNTPHVVHVLNILIS